MQREPLASSINKALLLDVARVEPIAISARQGELTRKWDLVPGTEQEPPATRRSLRIEPTVLRFDSAPLVDKPLRRHPDSAV